MELRSVQRDQHTPVQATQGIQAAALVQFGHDIVNMGWNRSGSIASSFARIWLSPGILCSPNSV